MDKLHIIRTFLCTQNI